MDIYQIWTTYNKNWSKYEILAFSVLLLLTVIMLAGGVCRKKLDLIQATVVVMMVSNISWNYVWLYGIYQNKYCLSV